MQPSPEIVYQDVPTGGKLELRLEGTAVARVFIHRFRMRVGAAVARVAGIGDASTDEPYRRRGFMRVGTTEPMLIEPTEPSQEPATEIALPQTTLARLALGAYSPQDVLERLDPTPDPCASELIAALFPLRQYHIYPPDWP